MKNEGPMFAIADFPCLAPLKICHPVQEHEPFGVCVTLMYQLLEVVGLLLCEAFKGGVLYNFFHFPGLGSDLVVCEVARHFAAPIRGLPAQVQ